MKLLNILTILLVLLQINTFSYGNYNNTHSNHYNSYNSVLVEQTYRGIGYTTNYSNDAMLPLLALLLLYVGYDTLVKPQLKK